MVENKGSGQDDFTEWFHLNITIYKIHWMISLEKKLYTRFTLPSTKRKIHFIIQKKTRFTASVRWTFVRLTKKRRNCASIIAQILILLLLAPSTLYCCYVLYRLLYCINLSTVFRTVVKLSKCYKIISSTFYYFLLFLKGIL